MYPGMVREPTPSSGKLIDCAALHRRTACNHPRPAPPPAKSTGPARAKSSCSCGKNPPVSRLRAVPRPAAPFFSYTDRRWPPQPPFDLHVPGRPDSSAMDWFAARGFDTWCMDSEGYGRSDKSRPINCDIANGADDLAAGRDYILTTTGAQ